MMVDFVSKGLTALYGVFIVLQLRENSDKVF